MGKSTKNRNTSIPSKSLNNTDGYYGMDPVTEQSEIENLNPSEHFIHFLQKHKAPKETTYTHRLNMVPHGNYNIPEVKLDTFYELFDDALKYSKKKKKRMSVYEKHHTSGPLVVQLVIASEDTQRQYGDNHLSKIVTILYDCLKKYMVIPYENFDAFIMEQNKPCKVKGKITDEIHIKYPFISLKPDIQYIVRDDFIAELLKEKVFLNKSVEELESIVVKDIICNKDVLMYGCSHTETSSPFILEKIYDYDGQRVPIALYNANEMSRLLSVRKYTWDVDERSIPFYCAAVNLPDLEKKIEKYRQEIADSRVDKVLRTSFISRVRCPEDLEIAKTLTSLLSKTRSSNPIKCLHVGKILHDIDYSLIEDWIIFTKLGKSMEEDKCREEWVAMKNKGYYLGTLDFWAKEDNPTGYSIYHKKRMGEVFESSIRKKGSDYSVGRVLYEKYKYQFVFSSFKDKLWYQFKNHRWEKVENGFELKKKISTELVAEYASLLSKYYSDLSASATSADPNNDNHKTINGRIEDIGKIIKSLEMTNKKKSFMEEAADLFYDKEFLGKLDENRCLLGVRNGVYDLELLQFREGLPDDYISMSTETDMIPYDPEDEMIVAVHDFVRKIHPNKVMRKYIWLLMASYIQGNVPDEKFHIWTGSGSNGKSKIIALFQEAMGQYCSTFPITLLTQKRAGSSNATPELADKKGIRFCVFQEPEEGDHLNVGCLKELSGGDKIQARGLYKETVYFKPQFKLLLTCNKLPAIPTSDGGTWRRLKVVLFGSKFVKKPVKKNEFLMDTSIGEKINDWKEAFLSVLVHYYKIYKKEGIVEPDEVLKYTKDYEKKSDIFMEYLADTVVKSETEEDGVSLNSLYGLMKRWYKETYADRKCPSKKELKEYLDKKPEFDGLFDGSYLRGYRMVYNGDEVEGKNNTIKTAISNLD